MGGFPARTFPSTMARSSRRSSGWGLTCFSVLLLLFLISSSVAVKHHDFKRCDQSGFCKRNRALADSMTEKSSPGSSPYQLDAASVKFKDGRLEGSIIKTVQDTGPVKLPLTISFLERGNVRVIIDEEKRRKGEVELRHGSVARKERYNEAGAWALTGVGLQSQK